MKFTQEELYKKAIGDHDAHGWIQWKGTDVCIGIYCKCGYHSHFDGEFAYFIQCPKCKAVYEMNSNIRLEHIENPDQEILERCKKPELEEEY